MLSLFVCRGFGECVFLRYLFEAQNIYPCMSLLLAYWLNMKSPSEESPNISFAMSMSEVWVVSVTRFLIASIGI